MRALLTERSRKILALSRQEAKECGGSALEPDHILAGILREGMGVAAYVLEQFKVGRSAVRAGGAEASAPGAINHDRALPWSQAALQAMSIAKDWSEQLGHDAVGSEHLLLGILHDLQSAAAVKLKVLGVDPGSVYRQLMEVLGFDSFGSTVLEALSSRHGDDQWIDRPSVSAPLQEAIAKGQSVALVGPRGVGKTALVAKLSENRDLRHAVWVNFELFMPLLEPVAATSRGSRRDWDSGDSRLTYIFEFRDGFERFCQAFPNRARSLLRLDVNPPGDEEALELLRAARNTPGFEGVLISDSILQEANRLAATSINNPLTPWSTLQALCSAILDARTNRTPQISALSHRIWALEREKDEAISEQAFERAAAKRDELMPLKKERDALMRDQPAPSSRLTLSLESAQAAMDRIVGEEI